MTQMYEIINRSCDLLCFLSQKESGIASIWGWCIRLSWF